MPVCTLTVPIIHSASTIIPGTGRISPGLAMALVAGTVLALTTGNAWAGPKGEKVARGSVQIERSGAQTIIRASNKAIINFESFNIGSGESVQFVQPGAKARVLNRVTGEGPTKIDGSLSANGRVYIVNPAGVIFGTGSVVNAAGIVAAGGELSNRDFVAGVDRFTNITGSVVSEGLMTAEAVHLIGRTVANAGTIVADDGVVSLLVGSDVMLRERGGRIMVRVDGRDIADGPRMNEGSGLGAGDAYSLAIRNSGRIDAAGGEVTLAAQGGGVRNEGVISAGVGAGAAGMVTVRGARIENAGTIEADAGIGSAGAVRVTSAKETILEAGSRISASGGAGVARGGEVLVHAYEGDTIVRRGAVVEVSGGAKGGDGGVAEVSAGRRLAIEGEVRGEAADGFTPASLLLDPLNIVIATPGGQSGEVGDGIVLAGEDPGAIWRITPGAIEGFAGDVRLEATNDIFVVESIHKANGGLTFLAGRDISFSTEAGGFVPTLAISARFIDFSAGRNIVDRSMTSTPISATAGDISLKASTGAVKSGLLSVPAGRSVSLTQAQSKFIGAGPFGLFADPQDINLTVNITDGFLIFGGDFGGVSGAQAIRSVHARSSDFLRIEDDLTIGGAASFASMTDVQVDGFVHAAGAVRFHGATDGIGGGGDGSLGVRFLSPGLSVWGSTIEARAGEGGPGTARANVTGNSPSFAGTAGAATRPGQFTLRQDAGIGDADLPGADRFGAGVAGMIYRIASDGAGVAISTPSKVDGASVRLSSATGSTIGGGAGLTLESLVVEGAALIEAPVSAVSFQSFTGAVNLGADITLEALTLSFQDSLDSAGLVGRSLIARAARVFLGGAVGAIRPLASLTVDGSSMIAGGSVRTLGDQRFDGAVTLGNHAALRSLGDGVIRFGAAVDGAFDLTIRTGEGGLIAFGGDVGTSAALRDLALSTAGESAARGPALEATIIGERSVRFIARDFVMGENEKLTAFGSLSIEATRAARVGDLVSVGDMRVSAPSVTLLLRPAGALTDRTGAIVQDRGLDFVSGGSLEFLGAVTMGGVAGAPGPTFGARLGAGRSAGPGGMELLAMGESETSEAALRFGGRVLDQRTPAVIKPPEPPQPPEPPAPPVVSDSDISADLAGARPTPPGFADSVRPESYDLSVLARIAVLGRGVSDAEAAEAMSGRAMYNDLPTEPRAVEPERRIVATRISGQAAVRAARVYGEVFGAEGAERYGEIGAEIADSSRRYLSIEQAASLDPAAFRAYLEDAAQERATLDRLRGVQRVLAELRGLGLTRVEYVEARRRILSAIVTEGGPSVEALVEIIEGAALAGGTGGEAVRG